LKAYERLVNSGGGKRGEKQQYKKNNKIVIAG